MKILKELSTLPKKIIKTYPDSRSEYYIFSLDFNADLYGIGYRHTRNLNICLIYISSPDLINTVKIMEMALKKLDKKEHELIYK